MGNSLIGLALTIIRKFYEGKWVQEEGQAFVLRRITRTVSQKHEEPREQRLKERSKFNFQTRNKIRLCDSQTRTKNMNMEFAKQM
jgi:hypothetical protein